MPIGTDAGQSSPPLVGTKDNPAREPKSKANAGKGSIGDKALMDSIILVAVAWALLVLLWYSVRNHNI